MSKLSKPSSLFLQKILSHYPLPSQSSSQKPVQSTKPKLQHLHDYRKVIIDQYKEREIYDKSTQQKLSSIKLFKDEGNGHYQHGRYSEASYFYQKAIVYGDYTFPEKKEDEEMMNSLLQKTQCNLGLSLIKMEEWEQAKNHLYEASRGPDPKIKQKAQFWLTKYFIRAGQTKEAKDMIDELKKTNPSSLISLQELASELACSGSKSEKNQKKMFSKMFQK